MIIYASRTGNVEWVINKLQLPSIELSQVQDVNEHFIIFTYTDGLGNVPQIVEDFLNQHHQYCKGVIASGNINFGVNNFCGSADKISKQYNVPIIRKIDLRGCQQDYDHIIQQYNTLREGW